MGVIDSLVTYCSSKPWFPTAAGVAIPGVTELIYFLIIIAAMYLRGGTLPERGMLTEARLPAAPRASRILTPAVARWRAASDRPADLPVRLPPGADRTR